ncbi:MAG: hypothetical protein RIS70_907 [Planctomycetota bacterium]|jgi:hypothetical protein
MESHVRDFDAGLETPPNNNTILMTTDSIAVLQRIYGGPDVTGMGSSVTSCVLVAGEDLEGAARKRYQVSCGHLWERFGPENWLGQWAEVYRRPVGSKGNIVQEIREIPDDLAALAASMLLDNIENPEAAKRALETEFNDAAIQQFVIYRLGDGDAYSGVLLAAQRDSNQPITFLTFLMD